MFSTEADEGLVDEPLHAIERTARPARNTQGLLRRMVVTLLLSLLPKARGVPADYQLHPVIVGSSDANLDGWITPLDVIV
jgi:hypothetical protein